MSWSVLFPPCLPAALEDKDVWHRGLVAEPAGDIVAGLATQAAAIDDDLPLRSPLVEEGVELVVPMILIQGNRAGDVGAGEIRVRAGIDPKDGGAPRGSGGERDLVGLPRGTPRMPESGGKRGEAGEEEEGEGLP